MCLHAYMYILSLYNIYIYICTFVTYICIRQAWTLQHLFPSQGASGVQGAGFRFGFDLTFPLVPCNPKKGTLKKVHGPSQVLFTGGCFGGNSCGDSQALVAKEGFRRTICPKLILEKDNCCSGICDFSFRRVTRRAQNLESATGQCLHGLHVQGMSWFIARSASCCNASEGSG